jgi:hypothetical protein
MIMQIGTFPGKVMDIPIDPKTLGILVVLLPLISFHQLLQRRRSEPALIVTGDKSVINFLIIDEYLGN